ncbi:MAG: hypothetical protein PHV56_01730 [Clostridia bacterium]|nr:hypothetical protein [Clostridia bacterium]
MNIKKAMMTLDELYKYGESEPNDDLNFVLEQQLAYARHDRWVITESFVKYTHLFEQSEDFINTLFCMEQGYLDYLLKNLLVIAQQMRAAKNSRGLSEMVEQLPVLAEQLAVILCGIFDEQTGGYKTSELNKFLVDGRQRFREQDILLFNGDPEYQRMLFYLDRVQQFKWLKELQDKALGNTIDDMWAAGRKISTWYELAARKNIPEYVLAPFESHITTKSEYLRGIIGRPWELFVLILAIIREQYEVEKDPAITLIGAEDEIQVMLTTRQSKELLYGSLNQFSAYLCQALDYALFPWTVPPVEESLKQLYEKEQMILLDGVYRLNPKLEEQLYTTSLGITFITNSRKLTTQMRKFIDELRVGR